MEYLKPTLAALNVKYLILTILQENRWLWVMDGSVATVSFCFSCLYCLLFEVLDLLQLFIYLFIFLSLLIFIFPLFQIH